MPLNIALAFGIYYTFIYTAKILNSAVWGVPDARLKVQ
jgi:hypothetical protein